MREQWGTVSFRCSEYVYRRWYREGPSEVGVVLSKGKGGSVTVTRGDLGGGSPRT